MANAFSGAAASVKFDGKPVGYCLGVSGQVMQQNMAVEVLEDIDPVEHVPVSRRVRVNCQFIKIQFGGVSAAKLFQLGDTKQVLMAPEITLDIYHKTRQELIWRVVGLVGASLDFGISRQGNAIAFSNIAFDARRFYDEYAVATAASLPF